jgi:triosephosphate isomerase
MRVFLETYAPQSDRTLIFAPPAASLSALTGAAEGRPDVIIAAQNIYWEEKGAYTGEMSAEIAREAGSRMTLVGHSERRRKFGETEAETAKKCAAAVRAGLVPMLCVGETDDERRTGRTSDVVARQLRSGVVELGPDTIAQMFVAYEPVWAIGTGRNATPEDASMMHTFVRALLDELTGGRGAEVPILYGGSVTAKNCGELLAAPDVDGLLVGGASLDPTTWAEIVRA